MTGTRLLISTSEFPSKPGEAVACSRRAATRGGNRVTVVSTPAMRYRVCCWVELWRHWNWAQVRLSQKRGLFIPFNDDLASERGVFKILKE